MAPLKNATQLGCLFNDVEPPKSKSILWAAQTLGIPALFAVHEACVVPHEKFGKEKGPSLGVIQNTGPHETSPNAPKFEDQAHEETSRQERCARGDALELAKSILMLKENDKASSFSLSDVWCLPAPSSIKIKGKRICCRF